MLLVRRRAPAGSFFQDGDRAAGVFGVLATGFSVLLGFIIFLAFQAYDDTRAGAETEATVVAQMVQTAQLMPAGSSQELTGELICYGRSVVGTEWDAVAARPAAGLDQPVGRADVHRPSPRCSRAPTPSSRPTTGGWQQTRRPAAGPQRRGCTPRQGIIPAPLWLGLYLICAVIFGFLLFFADSAEGALTQAVLMGSVARRHHGAHAAARLLRQPARRGARPAAADRDGALAAHHRRPGRTPSGIVGRPALRRAGQRPLTCALGRLAAGGRGAVRPAAAGSAG